MTVDYSPSDPVAGASRATSPTEVERWVDYADTIADVDTRLDTLESATYLPYTGFVVATMAGESNTTWTVTQNVGKQYGSYRFQAAAPAVGHYIEWPVVLAAGTYRLELQHTKSNSMGIITVKVDGAAHGTTIDGYNATEVIANSALTGVSVPTAGRRTIRLEVTSKNASSSNHYIGFSGLTLYRTGA